MARGVQWFETGHVHEICVEERSFEPVDLTRRAAVVRGNFGTAPTWVAGDGLGHKKVHCDVSGYVTDAPGRVPLPWLLVAHETRCRERVLDEGRMGQVGGINAEVRVAGENRNGQIDLHATQVNRVGTHNGTVVSRSAFVLIGGLRGEPDIC